MFKKPVRIKSNNQVKGTEKKVIKDLFCKSFPNVPEADVNSLFNNKKEPMYCMKLVAQENEILLVYVIQKQPMFFSLNDKIFPTVFLIWKFPDIIPYFTTHPQVMHNISSGADLMLPGVVTPPSNSGLAKYGSVLQEAPVYVNFTNNKAAVAVGVAYQSSFDMGNSGGKGKCVLIHHFYGDHLCSIEKNSVLSIPNMGPPEWLCLKSYNSDFPPLGEQPKLNNSDDAIPDEVYINGGNEPDINKLDIAEVDGLPENSLEMDELLHYCFLASIKYSKTITLPVLISNFFKTEMIPMCPPGSTLDIKKSSYKKLKPFLDDMAKIGLITIKEIKKGVEAINNINKDHPKFNEFYLKPEARPRKENDSRQTVITESYIVTKNVLPIFQPAGYQKGDIVDGANVRKCVTDHIKNNHCQIINDSKLVQPNTDVLKAVCKTTNPIMWEEVFEKVCESMKSCFKVDLNKEQIINKGKVSPIIMSVSVRSGNKKVTIVDNLEVFGININEFAKECQHGVAASTSITPTPPGKKCDQLLVQGNQVVFIYNLLSEKYKIPKKYIRGLELAPKKKK